MPVVPDPKPGPAKPGVIQLHDTAAAWWAKSVYHYVLLGAYQGNDHSEELGWVPMSLTDFNLPWIAMFTKEISCDKADCNNLRNICLYCVAWNEKVVGDARLLKQWYRIWWNGSFVPILSLRSILRYFNTREIGDIHNNKTGLQPVSRPVELVWREKNVHFTNAQNERSKWRKNLSSRRKLEGKFLGVS